MKNMLLIIAMTLSFSVFAQKDIRLNKTFLRVYDLQGKKIGKGRIVSISETTLELKHVKIPANNIGLIKTKHSAGNNLLTGAGIGTTTIAILENVTYYPNKPFSGGTKGNATVGGAFIGGILGAVIGGLTIPFRNPQSYKINGDPAKWKAFKEKVLNNYN